jgi:hypothetical protein
MNRQAWKLSHLVQVTAIATLLIVAIGFCLIHAGHHLGSDNGMCPDPCAMVASTIALVLLSVPLLNGRVLFKPLRASYAVSLHLLDPPPKGWAIA